MSGNARFLEPLFKPHFGHFSPLSPNCVLSQSLSHRVQCHMVSTPKSAVSNVSRVGLNSLSAIRFPKSALCFASKPPHFQVLKEGAVARRNEGMSVGGLGAILPLEDLRLFFSSLPCVEEVAAARTPVVSKGFDD